MQKSMGLGACFPLKEGGGGRGTERDQGSRGVPDQGFGKK